VVLLLFELEENKTEVVEEPLGRRGVGLLKRRGVELPGRRELELLKRPGEELSKKLGEDILSCCL
jgi:hypothetical protein